ncbi:hypothetical protein [Hansschlegelia sp. KR7-227]|uniref:hypothetical protein n=1 Tax=Hansschlegelia sp. KR7-227 TaxID=3400914 RepID=UPI003BFD960B
MTFVKLSFSALALVVSAGGAFATQDRRAERAEVVPMTVERTIAPTTNSGLPARKPAIHAVEERTTNDVGRVVTGGG